LKGIYSTTKDRSQPAQTSPCGPVFLRSFAVLVFCGPPILRSFAVLVRSSPGLWLVPGPDLQTLYVVLLVVAACRRCSCTRRLIEIIFSRAINRVKKHNIGLKTCLRLEPPLVRHHIPIVGGGRLTHRCGGSRCRLEIDKN
jgi:hypothetical protein